MFRLFFTVYFLSFDLYRYVCVQYARAVIMPVPTSYLYIKYLYIKVYFRPPLRIIVLDLVLYANLSSIIFVGIHLYNIRMYRHIMQCSEALKRERYVFCFKFLSIIGVERVRRFENYPSRQIYGFRELHLPTHF